MIAWRTAKDLILPVGLSIAVIGVAIGIPVMALKQAETRADRLSTAYMAEQKAFTTYKTRVESEAKQAEHDRKQAQAQMDADNQKAQEQKNAQIRDLQRRVGLLIDELRTRPERPNAADDRAPDPGHQEADAQLHCTGAQLYREDGAFLVGEAAAADQVRTELQQCQADLTAAHLASEQLKTGQAIFFGRESN